MLEKQFSRLLTTQLIVIVFVSKIVLSIFNTFHLSESDKSEMRSH